jgi:uncharacterized membrane protein
MALAVFVVSAAVVVRLAFLQNQSYWADEMFSVDQTSDGLLHFLRASRKEVHTPLYALLLFGWNAIGGTHVLWTHALSAIFGLVAIVVTFTGLRSAGLSLAARWTAVGATASSGFAIVYSQESRPYALALLGATGLTATVAAAFTALQDGRPVPQRAWLGWSLLAATAHLLGAVLVCVAALALVTSALRRRANSAAARLALLAGVALLPQLGWLGIGTMMTRGFAAFTGWIAAPGALDVRIVLTSVISAGGLVIRDDGFGWGSWAGLVVVAMVALVALALRLWDDGRTQGVEVEASVSSAPSRDGELAVLELTIAVVTLAATFVVAQVVHIWTLRNMIVVVPTLAWGVAWALLALPRAERSRRAVAVMLLLAMLGSLGPVARDLSRPYKTDWRSAVRYLAAMRAQQPRATFTLLFDEPPSSTLVTADRDLADPYLQHVYDRIQLGTRSPFAVSHVQRMPGPQAVLYYSDVAGRDDPGVSRRIMSRLADPTCHEVSVHGLVLVSCP